MLFSKNGSIPKPQTDGTDGWIEVDPPPTAPEGMEVVWWYPPGWVVRPTMPVKQGFQYNWNQSENRWTGYPIATEENTVLTLDEFIIDSGSASDTIPGAI